MADLEIPKTGAFRFIGSDWSMGYRTGNIYRLALAEVRLANRLTVWIISPNHCPYESIPAFYRNWEKV